MVDEGWKNAIPSAVRDTMRSIVINGMPAESLAIYARWFQLEAWLRDLSYVELRASLGGRWIDDVKAASGRQAADGVYSHMLGPDNENPLAYLDFSQLVDLIDRRWQLFEKTLIEKRSWEGRLVELRQIRHRIGHVRRPHADDLGRIEQLLRDLERGAFIALSTYNAGEQPDAQEDDPVVAAWLRREHEDAQRLIDHARGQYDTSLSLTRSVRPWAWGDGNLSGSGRLWHANFYPRGRVVDVPALWRDIAESKVLPLLVHLILDGRYQVGFTFSGADDATEIADAIGAAFDAVLQNSSPAMERRAEWGRDAVALRAIDYRIKVADSWTIVDETTLPVSVFSAGGGTTQLPRWR